jgi:small subunit ribosomal protein S20
LPNIKSAKKRVEVAEKNRLRNVAFKSSIKTAVKKVLESLSAGDENTIQEKLSKVYQLLDKAVSKGILHKNTVARKKSRLTQKINKDLVAAK